MAKLCNEEQCTGCAACMAACTHEAIVFHKDKFGFFYPQIDVSKCVDCKACEKTCPILNKQNYKRPTEAFACYEKNESERLESSSGGIATLLAKHFVEHDGVVYGCAFLSPMCVKHIRCKTVEDVIKLRGSKYVQSDLTEILPLLKDDLRNGKEVLFIGTPCQIAGIKSRFKRYSNLTLVDLVCHGVPSIQFLCDTLPKNICETEKDVLTFRTCNKFQIVIKKNGTAIFKRPLNKDMYLKGFFTGLLFRKSCYTCKFARNERVSDITIADFWKLKSKDIVDDGKGISLALLNTNKGTDLFNIIKENLMYEKRPIEEAFAGNEQLNHPYRKTFRETIFKSLYPNIGYYASLIFAIPDRLLGTQIKNILRK